MRANSIPVVLLIKAVEENDPTHGLLSGTTDPRAWDRALELW